MISREKRGDSRTRHVRVIGAATVLLLAIAACGPADEDPTAAEETDPAAETAPTDEESEEAIATEGECEGAHVRYGTNADDRNINPLLVTDTGGVARTEQMFDPMVRVDAETLEPVPHLAESWDVSDDALEYTFYLDERARFHDGEPITAEDVAFFVESVLDPDYLGPWQPDWLILEGAQEALDAGGERPSGLEVIDDHTVRFTLQRPSAAFVVDTLNNLKPVPKHLLEDEGALSEEHWFSLEPVGSGPYMLEEWVPGDRFVMRANYDYWGTPPCVETVSIVIIPDVDSLQSAAEVGEIDIVDIPNVEAVPRLEEVPGLGVVERPPARPEGLFFNMSVPELSDVRVRQAIAHAIDYDEFVELFMLGLTDRAHSHFTPSVWAYDPDVRMPDYDLDRARELLDEAGYSDGFSLEFYTNSGNPFRADQLTYVQEQLTEINIDVEIRTSEWAVFIDDVRGGDFEVHAQASWAGTPDPDNIRVHYRTGEEQNYSEYSNPEMDDLLDRAAAEVDQDVRRELYLQVQEILAEDLPFLPGFWRPAFVLVNDRVVNYQPSLTSAYHNMRDWRVDPDA